MNDLPDTFSPGPWGRGSCDYKVSELCVFSMGTSKPTPVCRMVSAFETTGKLSEAEANMRLIAAAPELLAFARAYLKAFRAHALTNKTGSPLDYTGHLAEFAKQVLVSATGDHRE